MKKYVALPISILPLVFASASIMADPFSDALRDGRSSCGLRYSLVDPNKVASPSDFPDVEYAPVPGIDYHVIGTQDFYRKGSLECKTATAKLVKNPTAAIACVMTLGIYQARVAGHPFVGTDSKSTSAKVVKSCVADVNYVLPCFSEWIACFKRN